MKTQGFLLKYPEGKSEIGTNGNLPTKDLTVTTWKELKDKRDAGKLTPGALYRITDYNCTTTQENTRSAGHQFDIVLLALSENKLAEEGWAMEHPSDIWTITFSNDATIDCYVYYDADYIFVVRCDNLKGTRLTISSSDLTYNEDGTATAPFPSVILVNNLTYNYFQNSNLSAWKVWYCLDNDTARFAWADNRDDASTKACINENLDRNQNLDTEVNGTTYYGWGEGVTSRYTTSEHPEIGDDIYKRRTSIGAPSFTVDGTVESYSPEYNGKSTKECIDVHVIIEGLDGLNIDLIYNGVEKIKEPNPSTIVMDGITYYTWGIYGSIEVVTLNRIPKEGDTVYVPRPASTSPTPGQYVMTDIGRVIKYHPEYNIEKGRGVIYRLIDEWNNDVAYDFKNIQFVRKLTDGAYDAANGEDTWVYTFNAYDAQESAIKEASVLYGYTILEELICEVRDNYICSLRDNITPALKLSNNCFLGIISEDAEVNVYFTGNKFVNGCFNNTIGNGQSECICNRLYNKTAIGNYNIFINNKKVLTES